MERLAARLEPANVAKLLARGFSLVLRDGHLVTRSAAVEPGAAIRIALGEGWLDAAVTGRDEGSDPLPGRRAAPEGTDGGGLAGNPVDPPLRRG
jgi:exodeoxyribonuclease VII large subunit